MVGENSKYCWIASRNISEYNGNVYFCNYFMYKDILESFSFEEGQANIGNMSIRPVVTLYNNVYVNIKNGNDGSSPEKAWTLR